jgi:folate-binding protein YgfZ
MFSYDEYETLQERAGVLDRGLRGRLRLTGADRRVYLQGLLTNDIVALSAGDGCYAALLTAQGRMVSDMRVSELGQMLLIDLPASTSDAVRARLEEFIFTEDVVVEDVQRSMGHFGLYGPAAATVLATVASRPVKSPGGPDGNDDAAARRARLDEMRSNGNAIWDFADSALVVVRSDDYGIPGFELFHSKEVGDSLSRALHAAGGTAISPDAAAVCRVEAGRPEFGIDIDEHTIPLEAGIEDRAISFTKGCYVGQEVIVRVLHRGHGRVARRLAGFVARTDDRLEPGARLFAGDDRSKEVGHVTSAVTSPRLRRPIGLGYVHRDYAEPGQVLSAVGQSGSALMTVVTLPFTRPAGG